MHSRVVKTGIALAATGLSFSMLGTAAASASSKLVVSEKFSFAGNIKPGPTSGKYQLTSTQCLLKWPGGQVVTCQLTSTVTVRPKGNPKGNATVTSSHGRTTWRYWLTPIKGSSSYRMKGEGVERDAPAKPGGPAPKPQPAIMIGEVTPDLANSTATGNVTVYERAH